MIQSKAEEQAENFIEEVKAIFAGEDGLFYELDTSVKKSNVISPSTVGDRYASVWVTLYNVSDPDDALSARSWMRLGELDAGVNKYDGITYDNPEIEIQKKFNYEER